MGFYRDGKWQPEPNEIAAGEYGEMRHLTSTIHRNTSDETIWSIEEIAEYIKMSVGHTRQRVVTQKGFPKKIKTLKSPRWLKRDIVEYFKN